MNRHDYLASERGTLHKEAETRIALVTDDGVTYYFYGFMGEDVPE